MCANQRESRWGSADRATRAAYFLSAFAIRIALIFLTGQIAWHAAPAIAESPTGWNGIAAFGPVVFPKYVGGTGTQVWPIPILSVNYEETFYVEIERVGVYVLASDDKKIGFGLAIEPRFGYSAKDGPRLQGMAKRRDSIEGGPRFDWDFDVIAFSVAYFADLSRSSRGSSMRVSIYKPLLKDDHWDVGALLAVDAMNSKVANYYFGVRPSEANILRQDYQPGGLTNIAIGLSGTYKLNKQHALAFGAIATRLPATAAASPIVETRHATTWYLGYGWNL